MRNTLEKKSSAERNRTAHRGDDLHVELLREGRAGREAEGEDGAQGPGGAGKGPALRL